MAVFGCFYINMTKSITAIEPQKKNPQRVNIYLGGEFAFGLTRIVAVWLKVGQELSDEKIAQLNNDEESELAYQKALHFLSYRPRSSEELRRNLAKRGVPATLINGTMERLQNAGMINDETFARTWVDNRNEFRPRSNSALRMELRRKGLDEETIQSVLNEQVDEEQLAFVAARKYARRLAGLNWREFRQKLNGFLVRRGFSYTVLSPVVSEVWTEVQTAETGRISDNEE
jgi:regulatory protein